VLYVSQINRLITGMALSREHTSAKVADLNKMLLFNRRQTKHTSVVVYRSAHLPVTINPNVT